MFKTCSKCNTEKPITDFHLIMRGKYRNSYCKPCGLAVSREWYRSPKGRIASSRKRKRYYAAHKEMFAEKKRAWLVGLWQKIFTIYGDACECCGESESQFLSIDHVNNDGKQHRKDPRKLHRWLASQPRQPDYRILCFNCNLGRARNREGICPHQLKEISRGVEPSASRK